MMDNRKCIIRTENAGVHYGMVEHHNGRVVLLTNAIRLWYWEGAFTLSKLAMSGTSKPDNCKFSVPVDEILLTEAIEIIPCTPHACESIETVKPHGE